MTRFIEIEGEMVRVIERQTVSTARLEDLLPHIERRPPVSFMVPRSAIWIHWDESSPPYKRVKVLCEIPPGLRSITKSQRRYRLAMPWTYFIFQFDTAGDPNNGSSWSLVDDRIFHSNAKVTGPQSRLWSAFLPNVYEDGRICFGSTGANVNLPLADRIDSLVNSWYLTNFNNDVHGSRRHPLPFNGTLPNGWREWVNATTRDGAAAWTQFPEWTVPAGTAGEAANFTLAQLLAENTDRLAPPNVTDAIPEMVMPMTFGRVEEWATGLDNTQRGRLLVALLNLRESDPALFTVETPATPVVLGDDGGEPI